MNGYGSSSDEEDEELSESQSSFAEEDDFAEINDDPEMNDNDSDNVSPSVIKKQRGRPIKWDKSIRSVPA